MTKSTRDIKQQPPQPKRSYRKHSPEVLVYEKKLSKNRAAASCKIPRSTAKKKLSEYEQTQEYQQRRLENKKSSKKEEKDSQKLISLSQTETHHQDQSVLSPMALQMVWIVPQYFYLWESK